MRQRVKKLCKAKGVTQQVCERDLGLSNGYLSKIDTSSPSAAVVKKLADYFGVSVEFILTGKEADSPYYMNDDARDLAEFMFKHPEYKVLFDASRKVKEQDIEFVRAMIERMGK